jgi:orotate phosphoribosyltransferase
MNEKIGKKIIKLLYDNGMIKTWYRDKPEGWRLASGIWSPFYINLRYLISYPKILFMIGEALSNLIFEKLSIKRLLGIAYTGIPMATITSNISVIPMLYNRKLEGVRSIEDLENVISDYGQHNLIEGEMEDGDEIALLDDLVTSLGSKLIAKRIVEYEAKKRGISIICNEIIVLIDREQGAEELAKKEGLSLYSIIPFKSKGVEWLKEEFSELEYEIIKDYLNNSETYQNSEIQEKLKIQSIKKMA